MNNIIIIIIIIIHPAHNPLPCCITVAISTIIVTTRERLNHSYRMALLSVVTRVLQFFQKFIIKLNNTDHDSIYLQGMKRSLAEKEMMSQGDYIIVDKPTSFDIFPYRNNNNNIVHCAGPFPSGNWSDIKLFKKVVVPRLAEEGVMIEVDRGYIDVY